MTSTMNKEKELTAALASSSIKGNTFKSSKERMVMSHRQGNHATVYDIIRDPSLKNKDIIRDKKEQVFPFVSGSHYKGEWQGDEKCGYGTEYKSDGNKYEGEWAGNKYHGKGTMWIKNPKTKKYVRQYMGDWAYGNMEGEGTYYYPNDESYRGQWRKGKKSGNGRYDYTNGDYYIGEWDKDTQNGVGSLFYKNGNVYEGLWMHGMKEGPGRFFYASTSKVYEGEWTENAPKCGEYREPTDDEMERFRTPNVRKQNYTLPGLELQNSRAVLDFSISEVRLDASERRGLATNNISKEALDNAKQVFLTSDTEHTGLVSIWQLHDVFMELGLSLTDDDIQTIISDLELDDDAKISFPETIDIVNFITANE